MAPEVKISLVGRVAIRVDGHDGAEAALGLRSRVALAYLVVERRRPVSCDELADVIWGADLPATWRAAVRGIVRRVRAALRAAGLDAASVLTSGSPGYELHLPPGAVVDVEGASAALVAAQAALPADAGMAAAQARRAVEGSRGDFLAGAGGLWVERRQAEVRGLHLAALEVLSRAMACSGNWATAIWAAEEAIAIEPFRESAHLCLMAAQAAAGNRGEALRAYSRCRHVLVEELGVGPSPETESAYIALLGEEPEDHGTDTAAPAPNNLPISVTSFVGREADRSEVRRLLGSFRLVTLVGMGGAGKSRLGVELARDLLGECPDGVWLVELATVAGSPVVAEQCLSAVGRPGRPGRSPIESFVDHLGRGTVLLVLDNCEAALAACASLCHTVLRACPGVRILATSREPLCVAGEAVWAVAPLAIPGTDDPAAIESLLGCESVRLFADRAGAACPGLDVASVGEATADICRRLDGIPLAIELAAARTRQLAVPEIARRLGDRFQLLVGGPRTTPERHRTLRQALDWSYEALSEDERRTLGMVAVFAGTFTVEAADVVCGDRVFDRIAALVDKSLVVPDRCGRVTRYRLLETVRAYGQDMLASSSEEATARRGLLAWATALADAAEPALDGPDQAHWLDVLDAELDNLRGVLDWSVSHPTGGQGLQIAASLWRYWEVRGFLSEGRSWLEALLAVEPTPPPLRAKALNSAGILAHNQLDQAGARAFCEESLAIRRSLGDKLGVAAALNGLGTVAVGEGDLPRALDMFEENLAASRDLGDERMMAASLMNLGVVLQLSFVSGGADGRDGSRRAAVLYEEALFLYRRLGDRRGIALALENLGAVAPLRGDYPAAEALLEESLVLRRELRDRSGIAASARFLGHLALRNKEFGAARRLHEEALAIESELGNQLLMATDLASLAEIAENQGDHAEAASLRRRALVLFLAMGDGHGVSRMGAALAKDAPAGADERQCPLDGVAPGPSASGSRPSR
ncbi:MAG: BTAD domain-containing putative transcriptional regulator [Acidimicrobiales bacterium]